LLDCSPATVWRHAKRLQLGQMLGQGKATGTLLLSPADVEAIRPHVGQRPGVGGGNPDFADGTASRRFWRSKAGRALRKKMRGNQRAAGKRERAEGRGQRSD
jgi:hypothetical protein